MNRRRIGGGIAGRILRVDLTTGCVSHESSYDYVRKTLGGRGTNSLIMVNEIPVGTKWDDPENLLCFGAGSLVGTLAPGACRTDVSSINVFNGGKGSANVGGFWGAELKYAGWDNLIISGISEIPVYLYVTEEGAEIRDAGFLWGKTTSETERALRESVEDENVRIALIGPAGERCVKGSSVMVDFSHAAGGCGIGCIMGAKKLKAVAVKGRGGINVAYPGRFMNAVDRCIVQCFEEPNVKIMRQSYMHFYSDPDLPNWDSVLVVRNGQDDFWPREKRELLMNPETGVPHFKKAVRACYCCPTGCIPYMSIEKGPWAGTKGEGFWVNTIMGHAARLDISDPEDTIKAWNLTNEMGLDGDYVAGVCSWAFECYEQGLLTRADTDGIELEWGNGNAFINLIKKLASREGIGDLLAKGVLDAARTIGGKAENLLVHVKGQPSIEPFRIPKGWALGVSTSPIGGRHTRGATAGGARFGPRPRPGDFTVSEYENQVASVVWQGKTKEIEDNLGICIYVGTWSGGNFLTPENYAELISACMGMEVSEEDLMEYFAPVGRNLEKAFNELQTEFTSEDDLPPKRFMEEKVSKGPYKGFKADEAKYREMLREFYESWKWDPETGRQTRSGLERLGLGGVADLLAERGKLIER